MIRLARLLAQNDVGNEIRADRKLDKLVDANVQPGFKRKEIHITVLENIEAQTMIFLCWKASSTRNGPHLGRLSMKTQSNLSVQAVGLSFMNTESDDEVSGANETASEYVGLDADSGHEGRKLR